MSFLTKPRDATLGPRHASPRTAMAHSPVVGSIHNLQQQCVAILGPKYAPLYLRSSPKLGDSTDTKWFFFAHSALDMVEERGRANRSHPVAVDPQPFLGKLLCMEDSTVYVECALQKIRLPVQHPADLSTVSRLVGARRDRRRRADSFPSIAQYLLHIYVEPICGDPTGRSSSV